MQPQDQEQPIINEASQDNQPVEIPTADLVDTVNAEAEQIQSEKYEDAYSQPAQSPSAYNADISSVDEATQTQTEAVSGANDFSPTPVITNSSDASTTQPTGSAIAPEKKKSNTTVILIAVLVLVVAVAAYVVAKYVLNLF
jgi:hypothetical protein